MQNTLVDLVKTLQAGMSGNSASSSSNPASRMDSLYPAQKHVGFMTNNSPGHSEQYPQHSSTGSGPTPPFYNVGGNPSFIAQSPSNSAGSYNQPNNSGMNWSGQGGQYSSINIDPALLSSGGMPGADQKRPAPPAPTHSEAWPQASKQSLYMSLPPSRGGSHTPDDILAPEEIINPLGAMTNMAGLVEAAVHRARNEGLGGSDFAGASDAKSADEGVSAKRRRHSATSPHGPVILEAQNLPAQSSKSKQNKAEKHRHIHAYPDAVEEGFVSEQEGRELMAM